MDSKSIRCIIFDFANTLCSEFYFAPLGADFQAVVKEAIFTGENKRSWASPWCCGTRSSAEVAGYLSGLTGITPERILAALDEGCANLKLNPAIWRFAQAQRVQGRQTALVTVNMDIFTRVVAPAHGFHQVFDVVINSSDYGTDDKNALCEIAFERLEGCDFENSLLIDDWPTVIEAFKAQGGMTYQYSTDEAFVTWVKCLNLDSQE